MKDLMIDIETMGNTSNAAMIQLAGVYFDRKTGETGAEFCRSLDLQSCLDCGFEKTQSTEDWWATQNQDVLNGIFAKAERPDDVIYDFSLFLKRDAIVWSHATFDFPIVQNYLKKFTKSYMNYKGARDIRTLVDLSGIDLTKYDWNTDKTHNALDDCKFQIKYCVDAMNMLRAA